ncbi:hypothetical protein GBAR_LOCUS10924 [Geodia barretti]|uniref:Uncharacterized protein n=1 Tax=Geodia barretti TaxID=519541 RepID=A0AA35RWY7_GEOBA|nr:hypothetical protein GBAR_LOCUS10924 [Geodia barretti]
MPVSDETLRRIVAEYGGFELSDAELALIKPELESYLSELQNLRDLDLSDVPSARLLRAAEGAEADA